VAVLVASSLIVRPARTNDQKGQQSFANKRLFSSLHNRNYSLLPFSTYYIVIKMPLNLNFKPYKEEILI
jgi:hypothetical protein